MLIKKDYIKRFGKINLPKLKKIVINFGIKNNPKIIVDYFFYVLIISGQLPQVTKAKKPIANFKLKANTPIGCKVTLTSSAASSFLFKLATWGFSRQDSGIKGTLTKDGVLNIGLKNFNYIPDLISTYDIQKLMTGMDISIHCNNNNIIENKFIFGSYLKCF